MTSKSGIITRLKASEVEEMIARGEDRTDWDRLRNMTEEEIEQNALNDYEEHGYPDWDGPSWAGLPPGVGVSKKQVTLRLDRDVIDWFKSQGKGYQTRMNAVLRQYMEHERKAG